MARLPKGTWDRRRGCYTAALGATYTDSTGRTRRRKVPLCYEDGSYVHRDDEAGRLAALARLKGGQREEIRRVVAPTVAELFQDWLDWMRVNDYSPATIASRRWSVNVLCRVPWEGQPLGSLDASAVTIAHLFAARQFVRGLGGSAGYVQTIDAAFASCLRWASKAIEGRNPLVVLPVNPFPSRSYAGVSAAPSGRPAPQWADVPRILDEMDRVVAARRYSETHRRLAQIRALQVRLIAERGCRPIETTRLRTDAWVGGDAPGFNLGRHKTSRHGVPGVIPLGPKTAERVLALIEAPDRTGPWVFDPDRPEAAGPGQVDTLQAWWTRIRPEIAGAAAYSLYAFRNAISNHLRLAGIAGRHMQLALRHTDEIADTVYRRDDLAEAARVFRNAGLE